MLEYRLHTGEETIGKIKDFYFDDQTWKLRYLIADTGSWLTERKVLVPPVALGKPDWLEKVFPVNMTKQQIEKAPPLESDKPVSRQHEVNLYRHFGWPPYWTGGIIGMPVYNKPDPKETMEQKPKHLSDPDRDPHLRSCDEVIGYSINAEDGEIGKVVDFIVDEDEWVVRYLVVDTHKWLPGKKVLIAIFSIKAVSWAESTVLVNLNKDQIKNSPEWNPHEPINREYEETLYDYYGQPHYWSPTNKV